MLGEVHSQYNLGLIYRIGEDTEQDLAKAFYWIEKAANQGLAAAQIDLAILYLQGECVEVDNAEAFKWTLIGEMNGDPRGERLRAHCTDTFTEIELQEGQQRAEVFLKTNSWMGLRVSASTVGSGWPLRR